MAFMALWCGRIGDVGFCSISIYVSNSKKKRTILLNVFNLFRVSFFYEYSIIPRFSDSHYKYAIDVCIVTWLDASDFFARNKKVS